MKWICIVKQDKNKRYSAELIINKKKFEGLSIGVDYKTLKEEILRKAGIVFVNKKELVFEKINNEEKIATIDPTQYRGDKGCIVTLEDRINGWCPCWD